MVRKCFTNVSLLYQRDGFKDTDTDAFYQHVHADNHHVALISERLIRDAACERVAKASISVA